MASSVVTNFVNQYLPDAQAVSAETGLSPDFVLGVAGQESGWGQHYTNNNLFGITGGNYASPDDSFAAFGALIATSPNYQGVINAGGDPQAEAAALGASPYNPAGAAYGAKVGATTQMVSNITGGISGNQTADPSTFTSGSGYTGGLAGGYIAPDGSYVPPQAIPGVTPNANANPIVGSTTGAAPVFGVSNWIEEISIRALMVIIGLALILAGFYLMGRRVSMPDIRIGALPGR